MAEIASDGGGGKHKGGKKRGKKMSTRVDFTPMVDLGFLLITFFMLTTSMNKPKTMEINMPDKKVIDEKEKTFVKESQTITVLLTQDDKAVYYFMKDKAPGTPMITDFSKGGIRATLLREAKARNRNIDSIAIYKQQLNMGQIDEPTYKANSSRIRNDKNGLIVIIKATDKSSYKNMVDILDEMLICNIGIYAIVDITDVELEMLKGVNLE
jgi:biopolymer transport protein ExbD